MCWSLREIDEVQEFKLIERLTFLEFRPVTEPKLHRSSSSPGSLSTSSLHPTVVPKGATIEREVSGSTNSTTFLSRQSSLESDVTDASARSDDVAGCRWSVGSALHSQGACKPCTWFWRPGGCTRGETCEHCHLCPRGALQKKKRQHRQILKAKRLAAKADSNAGYDLE